MYPFSLKYWGNETATSSPLALSGKAHKTVCLKDNPYNDIQSFDLPKKLKITWIDALRNTVLCPVFCLSGRSSYLVHREHTVDNRTFCWNIACDMSIIQSKYLLQRHICTFFWSNPKLKAIPSSMLCELKKSMAFVYYSVRMPILEVYLHFCTCLHIGT